MFVARSYHVYFRHLSVEYRPTLSADTRPISWPMIDRHLGRHSGEISTDTWSNVGRHVLQVGRPSIARLSIDTYRSLSVDTYRSTPIDRHLSVDTYRSSIDRYYRPTLGRYLGRYSIDISADTRPTYRPTLRRASVDMFFKLVDRQSPLSVGTWLICRSTLGRHLDRTRPTPRPLRYDEL